jgi:hypothetical protein
VDAAWRKKEAELVTKPSRTIQTESRTLSDSGRSVHRPAGSSASLPPPSSSMPVLSSFSIPKPSWQHDRLENSTASFSCCHASVFSRRAVHRKRPASSPLSWTFSTQCFLEDGKSNIRKAKRSAFHFINKKEETNEGD